MWVAPRLHSRVWDLKPTEGERYLCLWLRSSTVGLGFWVSQNTVLLHFDCRHYNQPSPKSGPVFFNLALTIAETETACHEHRLSNFRGKVWFVNLPSVSSGLDLWTGLEEANSHYSLLVEEIDGFTMSSHEARPKIASCHPISHRSSSSWIMLEFRKLRIIY